MRARRLSGGPCLEAEREARAGLGSGCVRFTIVPLQASPRAKRRAEHVCAGAFWQVLRHLGSDRVSSVHYLQSAFSHRYARGHVAGKTPASLAPPLKWN